MQRKFYFYLAAVLLLTFLTHNNYKVYVVQKDQITKISLQETLDHLESTTSKSTKLNSTWFFENQNVEQNDSDILKYIRDYHLTPPSTKPYAYHVQRGNPSEYMNELNSLLGNKRNGFFIECGANDGEFLSNTLALERDKNWTGLLIEANQFIVPELRTKNRKAWIADVCLSLKPYPQKLKFLRRPGTEQPWHKGAGFIDPGKGNWNGIGGEDANPKNYISAGTVECFPLFSLLSAINITRVDFMSLDIQGVEFKVLKNIPFEEIDIQVISAEYSLDPEGEQGLQDLMKSKGYRQVIKNRQELFFVKSR